MPHFGAQDQWPPRRSQPRAAWGYRGSGRSVTPWSHQELGWRNAGQQTPPTLSHQGQTACKALHCPSLAANLKKTQFCVLHDMADSSPGVVDAQISSGFSVWSTLERSLSKASKSFPFHGDSTEFLLHRKCKVCRKQRRRLWQYRFSEQ